MEAFLAASKNCLANLSSYERIRVVMGNPTCDLDSAVCALAQAYLEHKESESRAAKRQSPPHHHQGVIPVLNINRSEYRVKTEVIHHLTNCHIPVDLLTFRNEIDLHSLRAQGKLELVLVDHHALPTEDADLADAVIQVMDHRPQDPDWLWPGRRFILSPVGSCATLVAHDVLDRCPEILADLACLLRGPILVDTANFSKQTNKAAPLDHEIIRKLEETEKSCRCELYKELQQAKSDISQLTVADLLIKDLKVVNGIPIPGLPVLVKDFLELDGVAEALEAFCAERQCGLLVLMGRGQKDGRKARDLAVYSLAADGPANKVIEVLTGTASLQLTEAKRATWRRQAVGPDEPAHCILYEQANLQATRKQILPIVQSATSQA